MNKSCESCEKPNGASAHVVSVLNHAISNLMQKENFLTAIKRTGATPLAATPQEAEALVARDFSTWKGLVKEAAATVD